MSNGYIRKPIDPVADASAAIQCARQAGRPADYGAALAEIERLRAALEEIAAKHDGRSSHGWDMGYAEGRNECAEIARDALKAPD
jgi:hypothetical protein